MNSTNWPGGVDRSHANWTGRTPRTEEWGGNWEKDSYTIPKQAWIRAAAVLFLLFVLAPWLGSGAGF